MSWESVKLGSLVELITKGTTPTSVGYKFMDEGINFVKIESIDLSGRFIPTKFAKINSECNETLKRSQLKEGDILFSIAGALGRTALVTKEILPANTNQALAIIRLKDTATISKEFLLRVLASENVLNQLSEMKGGVAQQNLSLSQLKEFLIPIPPLATQKKIVAKLDAIFAEIDKAKAAAEANAKNAEALFQSYLGNIFEVKGDDWISSKLKDVCEKITDGTHQTPTYFDDGVVFLSSKNVTTGKIDWDRVKYIDDRQHIEMSKRVSPIVGDVLLAKNGTTGVAAMVDKDVVFDIYVSLALLRAKEQVLPQLLLYFVNSPVAKKQFNSRLKGIGVPNLHLQEIREVEISFPKSLTKQRQLISEIENFLDITSKQSIRYKNSKNEMLKLKQAILKQAFNGELVKD